MTKCIYCGGELGTGGCFNYRCPGNPTYKYKVNMTAIPTAELASMRRVIGAVKKWTFYSDHAHTFDCDCSSCNLHRVFDEYEKGLK